MFVQSSSVVNPSRIKGYALATMQRYSTDKLDSPLIASFCAKHRPDAWQLLTEEQRRKRALMRHRQDLLQAQEDQQNGLRDTIDEVVPASLQALVDAIAKQLESIERGVKK